MPKLTRRGFMKIAGSAATAAYGREDPKEHVTPLSHNASSEEPLAAATEGTGKIAETVSSQEIYGLLGFAAMNGEDPLKLWQRLRTTQIWRVGPLSPDSWSGCVFAADDADIFAFRTLSLPNPLYS